MANHIIAVDCGYRSARRDKVQSRQWNLSYHLGATANLVATAPEEPSTWQEANMTIIEITESYESQIAQYLADVDAQGAERDAKRYRTLCAIGPDWYRRIWMRAESQQVLDMLVDQAGETLKKMGEDG